MEGFEQKIATLVNSDLRPDVMFSLETGLHLGNVTSLRWSQVDLERRVCWIHADEITNFRWHDLRHTWASWHVRDGTPLPVLARTGG